VAYEQAAYELMALPLTTSSNVQTIGNLNIKKTIMQKLILQLHPQKHIVTTIYAFAINLGQK
jgi:hypothetical protein